MLGPVRMMAVAQIFGGVQHSDTPNGTLRVTKPRLRRRKRVRTVRENQRRGLTRVKSAAPAVYD